MTMRQYLDEHEFEDWLDYVDEMYRRFAEEDEDEDDDKLMDDLVCYRCACVPKGHTLGMACVDEDGDWFFFCRDCVEKWHREGTFDENLRRYKDGYPMWYHDFLEEKKGVKIVERDGCVAIVEKIREESMAWN